MAEDSDEEGVSGVRGMGDDDRGGGTGGSEAERAAEGSGGGVPAVGRHHEEAVAADSGGEVEGGVLEREMEDDVLIAWCSRTDIGGFVGGGVGADGW